MTQWENFYRHLLALCSVGDQHNAPEWTPEAAVQLEADEAGVRLILYRQADDEDPWSAMVHFRRDAIRGLL